MSLAEDTSDPSLDRQTTETADAADQVAENVAEMADRTKAHMNAGLKELQRTADEVGTEMARTVSTAAEDGRRFVRENPGMALAGAVGLGVLVGLALRPRN